MIYNISTHTPLAGRDEAEDLQTIRDKNFYSHAPRGARPGVNDDKQREKLISTHTPLAGRDILLLKHLRCSPDFYSHAPRGARR